MAVLHSVLLIGLGISLAILLWRVAWKIWVADPREFKRLRA